MPKAVDGPTWALLSPNKLPDASEVNKILGAICPDYENPVQNTIPDNAGKVIPRIWLTKPTEDETFKVVLERAKTDKARIRLGEILHAAFNRDMRNSLHLSSTKVKTHAVKQELKVFDYLKKNYKDNINAMIERAPKRSKGSVFAIEAIKTCLDAEISTQHGDTKSKNTDFKPPLKEAIMAGTGVPPPIDPGIELELEREEKKKADLAQTARGERIFAIQYRIIKKKGDWISLGRPKPPTDFDLKDRFVPDGPSMYGEDDGDELGDEEDDDDPDPAMLCDVEHTWGLAESAGGVIMTNL
jgi:hypothetical protein